MAAAAANAQAGIAGLNLGGGKAVIIGDPKSDKSDEASTPSTPIDVPKPAAAAPEPAADTHVTIVPYFTVPEGKMDEFTGGFASFYEGTKAGTSECLYYGFAVCGDKVRRGSVTRPPSRP